MAAMRFIMIGGFLGAGKTTTIARLARAYQDRGLRVGIVTNDQASDLVDTHTLRSQGLHVGEVAGACFCCHFDELTATVADLGQDQRPDVVIAEPVGSCTDLVATVIQPLRGLHRDEIDVAPYGVILKPSHGRRILRNEEGSGFSPKAAYIFRKQLEEADFVILNRIDELAGQEISELVTLLGRACPDVSVVQMSARTGQALETLLEQLAQHGEFGRRNLELDYDIYAAGEAELGWLNSSMSLTSETSFALDEILLQVVVELAGELRQESAEVAHLKVIGMSDGSHGVANAISNELAPELSLQSDCHALDADLIVNARVAIDPEVLQARVQEAVSGVCSKRQIKVDFRQTQSFRPGRPVPTHRYSEPVAD